MAATASIFDNSELGLDFVRELQGNEQSKLKALKTLKDMVNKRNKELSILITNLKSNKYSLPELEKMITQTFQMIKTTSKLSDTMQKIDGTDPSIPIFGRLIDKLVNEYNVIRNRVMQLLVNKDKLNKNIVDIMNQMRNLKRPAPKTASRPVTSKLDNKSATPNIKTIKLNAKDGNLAQKSGLKLLPSEAVKVLKESSSMSSGTVKQGFTTSFNRAGVIVVNNTNGSSSIGANNRVTNQNKTQENYDKNKFWTSFQDGVDTRLDDIKKLLKKTLEDKKSEAGGKGFLSTAAGWLFDLFESKIKNSKALKLFSKSFYKQAYSDLKNASRSILSGITKKAGSAVGIGEEEIIKVKAFKNFIDKQLESLKSIVKTQWNGAARLIDSGISGLVDTFSKGGKYVGASILGFSENIGGKLQNVTSIITKWSAETISGLENFGGKIASTFSSISEGLGRGISSITDLASKGIGAVKAVAGSIGDGLANSFKSVGGFSGDVLSTFKGAGSKALSFLGGAAKFLPFAGDFMSGYDSYKESGSVGRGVAATIGSAGGRIIGGATGTIAGPVGTFAGEVGGGIAGANTGNYLYDKLTGRTIQNPVNTNENVNTNPVVNPTPTTPSIGATALPDMGGSFKTAEDYEKAGYPVPNYLRKRAVPQSNINSSYTPSSFNENNNPLNYKASALLNGNADKAVLVKLTDETIGNLAMVLFTLFRGTKSRIGSGQSKFIKASYSEGGDASVSGPTGFGAGGIGGGSNNSALGGSFGQNSDAGFGNGGGAGSGGLARGRATAGGSRVGGSSPTTNPDYTPEGQAKLKDEKSLTEYAQAQASLHGEDPNSPVMKGMQSKLDGVNSKLDGRSDIKGSTGSKSAAQNEIIQEAMKNGATHSQAVALAGNFSGESLDPKNNTGDGGTAFGIGQWHPDRKAHLFAYAKATGKNPYDRKTQVAFAQHEMGITKDPASLNMSPEDKKATGFGAEGKAGKQFAASTTVNGGIDALVGHNGNFGYERPGNRAKAANERYKFAADSQAAEDQFKKQKTAEGSPIGAPLNGTEPSANSPLNGVSTQANAAMSPSGPATHVKEAQGGANTRTLPISSTLKQQLEYAGDKTGLQAEIFSGGQPALGSDGRHTGSTRHDNGNAADLKLYETGPDGKRRMLDMRNPQDAEKMKAFTVHAMEAGATGVGAAVDYMGPNSIHIGGGNTNDPTPGGKPLAWGAGGRAGTEDPFLRDAFKQGVEAQRSGAGAKSFAEWQAKKAEEAKAAAAKGDTTPDSSHLSAVDPQSKQASIFASGNTPTGLTPGMGLGSMAKKMQEGGSGSASNTDNTAQDKQDAADAEALHAKVIANAKARQNPTYSPGADSAKAYNESTKSKIDSEAVARRLGIGGDGTKNESDVSSPALPVGDVSYRTDANGRPVNDTGPAFDPLKSNQDFSHTITRQGLNKDESAALIANAAKNKGLNTKESQQILGQVSAETGFNPRSEDTSWSAAQLHNLWPKKFPTIESAKALAAKTPEEKANIIYGNRKDLGNNQPGDGFNFRGRGPNQLTGRAAYERIGKAIGVDLVKNPDAVNDPVVGAAVTAQFYKEKQLQGADLSSPYGATKATAPAQWKSQIDARGKAADSFAGKVDDLASQGDVISHPAQRIEDSSIATGRMSSDNDGNERIAKKPISSDSDSSSKNNSDSSNSNKNSKPGIGTATGGQTPTAKPDSAPQRPLQSASNDSAMAPMVHGSLGLCIVNSPGLV